MGYSAGRRHPRSLLEVLRSRLMVNVVRVRTATSIMEPSGLWAEWDEHRPPATLEIIGVRQRMNTNATDRTMMARCAQLARNGVAEGEYPFGSLIARGETIIAEGIKHSMRETAESRHAEIIAIARARRTLGKRSLRDCTLYSTVEPCVMCSFCIWGAGIGRVVFALHSPVLGGMSRWDILQDKTLSRRLPFCFAQRPKS
jgi:tRNA(Arg) A34 adenosine deaminase TadA